MKLNSTFQDLEPSSTLYINETVNRLWKEGRKVYHLGFGESRFPVHPKLKAALNNNAHQKSYLAAQGLESLRDTVASFYSEQLGLDFKSEQVMLGPGSKALIYGIQMALDTDLILPTPSWVSYAPQAHLLGRKTHYIPASIDNNYQFTIADLDKIVKASPERQKLLILNSPNNPSGVMFKAEFLEELAQYCRDNEVLVLSDEIYFLAAHENGTHTSIAQYYPEGTFVLGGLSKHLSLGGWRFGVALLPDTELGGQIMEALRVIASEVWSAVAAPVQYAAFTAYNNDAEINAYVDECTQIHGIRTRYLYNCLTDLNITCTKPEGGFYMVVNFDRWKKALKQQGIESSDDLSKHLLENYGLATLAGRTFGMPKNELSLRLATSYLDMEQDDSAEKLLAIFRKVKDPVMFMNSKNHPNMNAAIEQFQAFVTAQEDYELFNAQELETVEA